MPESETPKPIPLFDSKDLKRIEETVRQVRQEIAPLTEPVRQSSVLTQEDYSIRINARD
jgi:hypothetical protein